MAATTNFGLTKPDANAVGWNTPVNANFDTIDARLAVVHEKKGQTSSSTAINNTANETKFSEDLTIAGGVLAAGMTVRAVFTGKFSNTTGTPTLRLRARLGGVGGSLLADTLAQNCDSSAQSNMRWRLEVEFTVRSATTIRVSTTLSLIEKLAGTFYTLVVGENNANITVDLASSKVLCATAQWSAGSASNTITQETMSVTYTKP